ncbi:uncharacterized protein Tco025E_05749 [Trypanosoma conorhini]|uniref:Pleckstrin homology domain-containing protein n=1 Tax=Trypanosoma conorhini TaxID=83891 RepID=A0A3R7MGX9_9TRYP|nr:uncharacterized protein Tco025E_05749 [Trypanosoma conorhini]RNF14957.1 hypothetical protein Tco025E_05749 [Trypanosoma conorhini]
MSFPSGRRSRAVLAPPVLNPYEAEAEETWRGVGHRKSRSFDAVPSAPPPHQALRHDEVTGERAASKASAAVPPPLPPSPVVLVSPHSHISEEAGDTPEELRRRAPPRHVPAGRVRRQKASSPISVPRTRASGPPNALVRVDADAVSVSTVAGPGATAASSARDASCRETQRPWSAPSAQHTRHASLSSQDVSHRNPGKPHELSVGNTRRHGAEVEGTQPAETAPQEPHQYTPFVVQGAVTQKNPFRTQTYEEFCCVPDYSAPADCRIYQGDNVAYAGFQRATERELREQRATEVSSSSRLSSSASSLSKYLVAGAALGTLQTGDWFYKWTRRGRVHERYVWLDIQRQSLLWGPSPRAAFVLLSHLRIDSVIDLRPDCMLDEATQRTFYRLFVVTEERIVVFATELRDKFDVWFDALQKIVLAHGSSRQWGQLWGSPSAGEAAAVEGRWISRCSPLHAILHGYESPGHLGEAGNVLGDRRSQVLPSD